MASKENFVKAQKLLMVIADAVVFAGVLLASIWLRFSPLFGWETGIPGRNMHAVFSTLSYAVAGFIIISIFSGIYVLYNKTPLDVAIVTVIDMALVTVWIGAATFAGSWLAFPRMGLVINAVLGTVVLIAWRWLVYAVYRRVRGDNRVMVLTVPNHESKAVRNFASSRSPRHVLTHIVDGNYLTHLRDHLDDYDSVHVSSHIDDATQRQIFDYLLDQNKQIFMTADFERLLTINPTIMSIEDESIMLVTPFQIPAEYNVLKRSVDFLIALIGLIIASPIMLVAAVLVKTTSPGPILYKQVRITKGNREFEILKFRSMTVTAEQESGPVLATTNDARVTTVGKYLRSMRIDELPQLINVLRGDMAIVGPRPERPFFVEQFTALNAHYPLRHNVRAGITGYAQVYGKYASDFQSKLNFDLLYIKRYSPLLDLKIMLQTVKILFDKVSSRGLEDADEAPTVTLPSSTLILH